MSIGANSALPDTTGTLPNPVVIYDALVFGACETLNSFPVDHFAFVDWNGAPIGAFHGVDNTTIDCTGFYTFKYGIRLKSITASMMTRESSPCLERSTSPAPG